MRHISRGMCTCMCCGDTLVEGMCLCYTLVIKWGYDMYTWYRVLCLKIFIKTCIIWIFHNLITVAKKWLTVSNLIFKYDYTCNIMWTINLQEHTEWFFCLFRLSLWTQPSEDQNCQSSSHWQYFSDSHIICTCMCISQNEQKIIHIYLSIR